MRKTFILVIVLAAILLQYSCDKPTSSLEASDEEAMYNIMFTDYYRLSTVEIFYDYS